jgi:hypothetical protein
MSVFDGVCDILVTFVSQGGVMRTFMTLGLATVAALTLAGCGGSPIEKIKQDTYVLIVHDVTGWACSSLTLDQIREQTGINDLKYYDNPSNSDTCRTFDKVEEENCWVRSAADTEYSGNETCVFSTSDDAIQDMEF